MTPKELRRALKARIREQRAAARAAVASHPLVRAERRKRWIRRGVISSAVLLLLLFIRCDCGEAPAPEPVAVADAGVAPPPPKPRPPAVKVKLPPLDGKVQPQPRPAMQPPSPGGPPWLEEFRIQVAARSPRLAQCFTGTERPGALRWSARVSPQGGAVSDQELEPVGVGVDLSREQRDCVSAVLQKPAYRLPAQAVEGLPDRVSLVIEF